MEKSVGIIGGGNMGEALIAGVIQSDGAVKACEMLDDSLGNIRDFDYDLGKSRVVEHPDAEVGFGDDRAVVPAELVSQNQLAGVAAALDHPEMQVQPSRNPRHANGR